MEQYLIDDYDLIVIENETELRSIERYEDFTQFFDCGQGYYEDTIEQYVFCNDKYYIVTLTGQIGSQRMDVGDRVYWVDEIESIEVKEIEKPQPLKREDIRIEMNGLTDGEKSLIKDFLNKNKIKHHFI